MINQETMVALAEEYLAFRRRLGYALRSSGITLLSFARYADEIDHKGPITVDLAVEWAGLPGRQYSTWCAKRLDLVRRFAKHRALYDPATEIPPEQILGSSWYRRRPPRILSQGEIGALLLAASKLGPDGGLGPQTYVTLLGLLASTGLRISEALGLGREDVDWEAGVLTIRMGKFKKSRLVPLHPTTVKALRCYSERCSRHHPCGPSEAFFLNDRTRPLKYGQVRNTFASLRQEAGLSTEGSRRPPRLHDLRHTFAVRTLLRWYEEGADLDHKIAALSTYLGHVKVTNTYWYLTAVPELLAVVSSRFEDFTHKGEMGGRS